jgi:hypothetical protein
MALQSNADFRILNGLLQVSSVFDIYFLICNFAFINICLYTIPPYIFLVIQLVDLPVDYY